MFCDMGDCRKKLGGSENKHLYLYCTGDNHFHFCYGVKRTCDAYDHIGNGNDIVRTIFIGEKNPFVDKKTKEMILKKYSKRYEDRIMLYFFCMF